MLHALEATTAGPRFNPAEAPVEATVSRGGGALAMTFEDGARETVQAMTLRLGCRCAWCGRARLDGRFPKTFDGAAIVAVEPLGGHAVHIVFADGHDRGIFPWSYIRELAAGTGPDQ